MIGQTLSHYEITALLGSGGMGEVYRARDPRLDRDVAVKVLPSDFARDPALRKRFEYEARALAALSHPNTVPIFDFGVHDGIAFAVMELLEGRTLEVEIKSGVIEPERAVDYATGIARGLVAAHAKDITHRDLKPANVMIMPDGHVKILDFGLSHRRDASAGDATVIDTALSGGVAGTPGYLAPERIRGETGDHRADIFAVGVIVHQMLTGKRPFERASTQETLAATLRDDAAELPGVPEDLAQLLRECLQKDPARRIGSASELERRLAACLQASATPPEMDSIAVLPFHNEAGDDEVEYLIDGLTDSLIDTLSCLPQLKVLARSTVFQRRDLHDRPLEVGRELGVRAVLTGRLQNVQETLVVRTELVDVTDGSRLWGARLRQPRGDLFAIEEQICEEITDKLRLRLSTDDRQALSRRRAGSAEARDAYMQGRFIWNRWKTAEAMRSAIGFFEQALSLDPMYALAFGGLADSYAILGNVKALPPEVAYPKAKDAALAGLAIDDQLAELHTSLGFIQRYWEWDWTAARRSFDRALQLNPGYSTAHRFKAHLLSGLAEHDLAIASAERSLALDPLSLILHTSVGDAYFYARRYEEAIDYYRKCIELDPAFTPGHTDLARALELTGCYEEALEEYEIAQRLAADRPSDPSAGLACVYASMGRREDALRIVDELRKASEAKYVSPYSIASIHACLGDVDAAVSWLQTALTSHDQTLVWVKVHPRLDPVRGTEGYAELLRQMKL